ncbi:hypothetical protein D9M68_651900 [compost metagenome]
MRAHHIALAAIQLRQLLERGHQAAGVQLLGLQQIEGEVVGGAFLRLRELRVDEFLGQVAQLRGAQGRDGRSTRGAGGVARGGDGVGGLHRLLAVAQRHVADFVADHAHHFVVGHHVHQAAIDADASVGHGPRIDVLRDVDLVAGLLAVHRAAQRLGNLLQAGVVLAAGSGDLLLRVALGAGLVRQGLDFGVAQRGGLDDLGAGAHQSPDVQRMRGGIRGKRNGQRGNGVADLHGNKLLLTGSMPTRRQFYIWPMRSERFGTQFRKCQFFLHKTPARPTQSC